MASSISKQLTEAIYSFHLLYGPPSAGTDNDNDTGTGSGGVSVELIAHKENAAEISEDFDDSKESCIRRIGQCLTLMQDTYHTEMKRSTCLQEFLMNELNHTEDLVADLRNTKEELNIVQKQRENYKKKCESQVAELEMLTSSKVIASVGNSGLASTSENATGSADPQTMLLGMRLLGKFVGKNFPGWKGDRQCINSLILVLVEFLLIASPRSVVLCSIEHHLDIFFHMSTSSHQLNEC